MKAEDAAVKLGLADIQCICSLELKSVGDVHIGAYAPLCTLLRLEHN